MGFLAELLEQVGLPEGVVSVVPADRETSEYLVSHRDVDKIAFTGSTRAGRRIAAIAGEQLKRVSLELGGKSAAIILPDAHIDKAVASVKFGSLLNNGESCIAQTRILAPRSRYEEVVAGLKELVESLKVGDPEDPDTFIGPMIRPDQQERVRHYIRLGIEEGARLVTGGPHIPEGLEKGNYVTPTVFADVDNSMRIAQEEIFGPVLVVIATTTRTTPSASPTTPSTACPAACGPATRSAPSPSPAASAPAQARSTVPRSPSTARSAASRPAVSAASTAPWASAPTPSTRPSPSDRDRSHPCTVVEGCTKYARHHLGR
jgi:hypothetical protein